MKSLKFDRVTFGYDKRKLLFNDTVFEINADTVAKGHIVALMGASGTGKSTLFKLVLGNEKPLSGKISFQGENDVIAYLPQEPVLFEHLSPARNASYFQNTARYGKHFNQKLFDELVVSLGMGEVLAGAGSVSDLSGGQRQRLSLLRALSINPSLLLLDEPTNGLDAEIKMNFLSKLREITDQYGLLVIYISHHKLEAETIADEVLFLHRAAETAFENQVYQGSILDFIQSPPLLDALKVFQYPHPNILLLEKKGTLLTPVRTGGAGDRCYIGLRDEHIRISDNGWPYEVVSGNPVHNVIRLSESGQLLTLSTKLFGNTMSNKITIHGSFNAYDLNGKLIRTIQIKHNTEDERYA